MSLSSILVEVAKLAMRQIFREKRPMIVNMDWLGEPGYDKKLKDEGYETGWTAEDRVETRKLEGWKVASVPHRENWQRLHKIPTLRDGSVLMKRKRENDG